MKTSKILFLLAGILFIAGAVMIILNYKSEPEINQSSSKQASTTEKRDTIITPIYCHVFDTTFIQEDKSQAIIQDGVTIYQDSLIVTARVYKQYFQKYYRLNEKAEKAERIELPAVQYKILNQEKLRK